jgi:hypothetical protein
MFESIEMPSPEAMAGLDDLGLVDAVATATLVESLAVEVRIAAIQEMYTRQLSTRAPTRPPRAALPSSRRRRRKARKRRNRRR